MSSPGPTHPSDPRVEDVLRLARERFLADERVDMQVLAAELGIGRATLYRWVEGREELLDRVLGELAVQFFDASRAQVTTGDPDEALAETVRILVTTTSQLPAVRGFAAREPQLALRLVVGRRRAVRRRLIACFQQMTDDLAAGEAGGLAGFSEAIVTVGLALVWPSLAVGDEPSGEEVAAIVRSLLVGARAGQLSATRGPEPGDRSSLL